MPILHGLGALGQLAEVKRSCGDTLQGSKVGKVPGLAEAPEVDVPESVSGN